MGIGEPFRIQPQGPVTGYRSFGMTVTKWVKATCEEFGCEQWERGWVSIVVPGSRDENVLLQGCNGRIDGLRRASSGVQTQPDGFVRYTFEPGQPCFKASTHQIPWDGRLYHRPGDWRGNPDGPRAVTVHPNPQSWVDEFAEHQLRVAGQRERYGAE